MKKILLFLSLLALCSLYAVSLTFHNEEMMMEFGNSWMFNMHEGQHFNEDVHAFTAYPVRVFDRMSYNYASYPFTDFGGVIWSWPSSSSLQSSQDFPPMTGHSLPDEDYILAFGERNSDETFILCSYLHLNTVNGDWNWKTMGQAGDTRMYSGATVYLRYEPNPNVSEILLKINDCSMYTKTAYPSDIGTGEDIIGYAWGTLDQEVGDPAWIAAYSNPTGQVEMSFQSSSAVVQWEFGRFNSDILLRPSTIKRDLVYTVNAAAPYTLNALTTHNVQLTINSGSHVAIGGEIIHSNSICKHYASSTGNYPAEIVEHYDTAYWEVGNTFDHSNATILFDFSEIEGVDNPQNLRVLRRRNGYGPSWDDTGASLISTNPLRFLVSGNEIMGQYCLGSTGGNNFVISPPENLSIIRIEGPEGQLLLNWNPVYGATAYRIYSADSPQASDELWILEGEVVSPQCTWQGPSSHSGRFYLVRAVKE